MTSTNLTASSLRWSVLTLSLLFLYVPRASALDTAVGISGVYDGTYTCAIGPRTLKLTLQESENGSLTGIFTFYLPPASHTHAYSYSLKGTFNAVTGRFTLAPVKWESSPPGGYSMVGMEGIFDPGIGRVSGKITYAPCTAFLAARNSVESAKIAGVPPPGKTAAPPPAIALPRPPLVQPSAPSGEPAAAEKGPVPATPSAQPDAASTVAKLNEYIRAANAALKTGDVVTAVTNLKEAAKLSPTNEAIWAHLGDQYLKLAASKPEAEQKRLFNEAANAFATALKLKPDDAGVAENYAIALGKLGRIAEARAATDRAVQLDPSKTSKAFYNLAITSFRAGENREALEAMSKISQSAPEYKRVGWLKSIITLALYIESAPSSFQDLKDKKVTDDTEARLDAAKLKQPAGGIGHFVLWDSSLSIPGGHCFIQEHDSGTTLQCDFDEGSTVEELRHSYELSMSMVTDALGSNASGWTSNEVRVDPSQGLTHLFHGPGADVRVEIYHRSYGPASSDQHAYRTAIFVETPADAQARAQGQARQRETVCVSDDLALEWRNPSAGGKMEKLKQQLVASLRERANTPGYDQTRWIVLDSVNYPAWNPGTSFGAIVSTQPSGSCAASKHREVLALTP